MSNMYVANNLKLHGAHADMDKPTASYVASYSNGIVVHS